MKLDQRSRESGQTMVEYLLLTAVIVIMVTAVISLLQQKEYFFNKLTKPIVAYLKYNYKYGNKDALGWDEAGGPRRHVQISTSANSFRLFLPQD